MFLLKKIRNKKFFLIFFILLFFILFFKIQVQSQTTGNAQITSLTTSSGACYIRLNWECSGDCQTPYILYRSQNLTMEPRETFTTTVKNYEFINLDFNKSYYFQVKAQNSSIYPPQNGLLAATKSLNEPTNNPKFNQISYSNNNFTLYFNTSSFQDLEFGRYEIEYASSSNLTFNNFVKLDKIPAKLNQNFYSPIFSLSDDVFYRFKIKAVQGGYGCRLDQEKETGYNEVLILARPTNLTLTFNFNPNYSERIIINWQYSQINLANSFFEIYRKEENSDFQLRATTSLQVKEFKEFQNQNLKDNAVYYYKIRACYKENNLVFCSPFSEEKRIKNTNALQNFKILYLDYKNFDATFSWENPFSGFGERNHIITQEKLNENNVIASTTYVTSTDLNTVIFSTNLKNSFRVGRRYKFYVQTYFGNYPTAKSNEIEIDLTNINPIKGWAWSNIGLGWLRLSNDSLLKHSSWQEKISGGSGSGTPTSSSLTIDNISYGLYFVSTSNIFSGLNIPLKPNEQLKGYILGQAWSPYYGWLYFENYNKENCPNLNEPCFAYVVKNNEGLLEIRGWARFENLKDENGYSWLSLNRKQGELSNDKIGYGLYLFKNSEDINDVYYYIRGLSWHSNFGWVSFGGPILKSIKNIGINPQNRKAIVEIEYLNLVDYNNNLEIFSKTENSPFSSIMTFSNCLNNSYCKRTSTKVKVDRYLKPNTFYKIKISGN